MSEGNDRWGIAREWLRPRRIKRTKTHVIFNIEDEERSILAAMTPQLRELLVGVAPTGPVEAGMARLFPTAHPDDADRDTEYQAASRDRLLAARLDRLDIIDATMQNETLTFDEHEAWVMGLNDLRLVLGTRLDVAEDDEPFDERREDQDSSLLAVYHYLGHLLMELLDASGV